MGNVLPKHRAREYETIFILHPDADQLAIDKVTGRCEEIITRLDGKIIRAENWGKRRLSYPVRKNPKGIYIYILYLGYQDLVHEIERNLRMLDTCIKYLTVKIDQDVDPNARPIDDGDISFAPRYSDEPEVKKSKPDKTPADGPVVETKTAAEEAPSKPVVETKTAAEEAPSKPVVETKTAAEEAPSKETKTADEKPADEGTK